jgi:Outer membrane lipoprotein-sorting protein
MKKSILAIVLISLIGLKASAQNDPAAEAILDKTSAKNNSYKTIKANFKFISSSLKNNQSKTELGKILIKGEKYHLTYGNSDIYFDGKNVYNYLKSANELNISKPESSKKDKGSVFFSNPRDIFRFYSKNFKSKLIGDNTVRKQICYEIDLYPIDIKVQYTRIRAHIEKNSLQIVGLKVFYKDGAQYEIEISNFGANHDIPENEFVFDSKKHPGIQINDMRF